MEDEATPIENEQLAELEQRRAEERLAEEKSQQGVEGEGAAKPAEEHFINSGEAVLLLAFTGIIAIISVVLDWLPYFGWIINLIINLAVGGILLLWLTGKVAKGAPKKWYKAIYYGALGSFFGGYFGAIIWLLIQDRKVLGKVAGKLGEKIEEQAKKVM